jgi:hypothetical protein
VKLSIEISDIELKKVAEKLGERMDALECQLDVVQISDIILAKIVKAAKEQNG